VLDDLSNGSKQNLDEFSGHPNFSGLTEGNIADIETVRNVFDSEFDICLHLAAQINVQESLENPETAFRTNLIGTYNILESALRRKTKLVLMGTCMVYDVAQLKPINEEHPIKALSPYAGSKVAAENLALSYYHGLKLPVVVLRPFNVFGPFQKSNMEGGVVSIFIKRFLKGQPLEIYGDGTQTRDLLYVDDCAEFIYRASLNENAVGEVINAGIGRDITINDLAMLIAKDSSKLKHVEHIHPQSEIPKLLCDYTKAKSLLGWEPKITLEEGIERTKIWIKGIINPENI
jgi:nucleoside-diphosphate-sugar epimerase